MWINTGGGSSIVLTDTILPSTWLILLNCFPSSLPVNSGKGPRGQNIQWWELKLSPQEVTAALMSTRPCMIDPKTMINLTFAAQLPIPIHLSSLFILHKFSRSHSTLEIVLGTLVFCPSVGLTGLNSFLVSPPLVFLPLQILSVASGETWSVWVPSARCSHTLRLR